MANKFKNKVCEECEKEYTPTSAKQKYCKNEHYRNCPICNKPFLWTGKNKACSNSCGVKYSNFLKQQNKDVVKKSCEFCGKDFIPDKSTQRYCQNPHPYNCENCGKDIKPTLKNNRKNYFCKKCSVELNTKQTNLKKYGVENVAKTATSREKISSKRRGRSEAKKTAEINKFKKTNLEKYGVEFPLQNEKIKEKVKNSNLERYGVENPGQSKKIQEKIRQTNKEKYGVDYGFQSEEVKEKIKQINLKKYGVETSILNPDVKAKAEATNLKKYGYKNAASSDIVKSKIKETNKERFGVDYSFQAEEVKEKIKETNLEKYGVENPAKNPEVKEKTKKTNLEKYGTANPFQTEAVREKYRQTSLKKYGTNNPAEKHIKNYEDYLNFDEFVKNNSMTIRGLAKYFNLSEGTIRSRVRDRKLDDFVIGRYKSSMLEESFAHHFDSLEIDYIRNDRKVLGGKELDFYFPEFDLAVEISPTSTHHSLSSVEYGVKEKDYHKNKFLKCAEQGIELITIFDWHDWDKVLEMIENKLTQSVSIYARNSSYSEFGKSSPALRRLIGSWHVLGMGQNSPVYKYSVLKDKKSDEILGIAAWSKTKDASVIELKRLVFKPGFNVVGGFSKLLKNFNKNNSEFKSVITFSDCDLGQGLVYEKNGFELIEESRPNLNYYNWKENVMVKKLSLVLQGADRILKNFPNYVPVGVGKDLPSNEEIILSYDFYPVFDCGYRKWIKEF